MSVAMVVQLICEPKKNTFQQGRNSV